MKLARLHFMTIAGLAIFFVSMQTRAQRSFTAAYDSSRKVTLEGIVTKVDWVNPRAFLFINVKDSGGSISNWAVEFGNPLELEKNGWKSNTLKIGDVVSVEGLLARGEARQAAATSIVLKASGRKIFTAVAARRPAAAAAPAPRWPNGHVRLGPPPGRLRVSGARSRRDSSIPSRSLRSSGSSARRFGKHRWRHPDPERKSRPA